MTINIECFNENDTIKFAETVYKNAKKGDIICLNGELGVGKTVFVKAFAKAMGINNQVVSPTFTIMNTYTNGTLPLYHFDVYRITNVAEMENIDYEDYFFDDGITIVEWASNIKDIIPDNATWITFERDYNKDLTYRNITYKHKI